MRRGSAPSSLQHIAKQQKNPRSEHQASSCKSHPSQAGTSLTLRTAGNPQLGSAQGSSSFAQRFGLSLNFNMDGREIPMALTESAGPGSPGSGREMLPNHPGCGQQLQRHSRAAAGGSGTVRLRSSAGRPLTQL